MMGRTKDADNRIDPESGKRPKLLPVGVSYRGPSQYRVRALVAGERITQTFETAELADEWLKVTKAAAKNGTFVDRRSLDQSTVAQLVQSYVDKMMQDGGTCRGAKEDRQGHIPALLGDRRLAALKLSKLTADEVKGFADRQAQRYAPSTVVKRLNLLQSILGHAIAAWKMPLPGNAASATAVPRPAGADLKRERRLLTPSRGEYRRAAELGEGALETEQEALYAVLAQSQNKWDLPLAKWAVEQGTRQGEALGLQWGDIDWDRKVFRVHGRVRRGVKSEEHRKSLKPEIRPLMASALALLLSIKPEGEPDPDSLVFPVGNYMAYRVRIGRLVAKAGARMTGVKKQMGYLQGLTNHDLRHEAVSRLALIFTHWSDLSRVVGHHDEESLNRYYQPDLTGLAE